VLHVSSSDESAIRDVIPVSWMTSCFSHNVVYKVVWRQWSLTSILSPPA